MQIDETEEEVFGLIARVNTSDPAHYSPQRAREELKEILSKRAPHKTDWDYIEELLDDRISSMDGYACGRDGAGGYEDLARRLGPHWQARETLNLLYELGVLRGYSERKEFLEKTKGSKK